MKARWRDVVRRSSLTAMTTSPPRAPASAPAAASYWQRELLTTNGSLRSSRAIAANHRRSLSQAERINTQRIDKQGEVIAGAGAGAEDWLQESMVDMPFVHHDERCETAGTCSVEQVLSHCILQGGVHHTHVNMLTYLGKPLNTATCCYAMRVQWFRAVGKRNEFQVIPDACEPWLTPTADDIGARLLAKVMIRDEGTVRTKLLEYGPIKEDPDVRSKVEMYLERRSVLFMGLESLIVQDGENGDDALEMRESWTLLIDDRRVRLTCESSLLPPFEGFYTSSIRVDVLRNAPNELCLYLANDCFVVLRAESHAARDMIALTLRAFCASAVSSEVLNDAIAKGMSPMLTVRTLVEAEQKQKQKQKQKLKEMQRLKQRQTRKQSEDGQNHGHVLIQNRTPTHTTCDDDTDSGSDVLVGSVQLEDDASPAWSSQLPFDLPWNRGTAAASALLIDEDWEDDDDEEEEEEEEGSGDHEHEHEKEARDNEDREEEGPSLAGSSPSRSSSASSSSSSLAPTGLPPGSDPKHNSIHHHHHHDHRQRRRRPRRHPQGEDAINYELLQDVDALIDHGRRSLVSPSQQRGRGDTMSGAEGGEATWLRPHLLPRAPLRISMTELPDLQITEAIELQARHRDQPSCSLPTMKELSGAIAGISAQSRPACEHCSCRERSMTVPRSKGYMVKGKAEEEDKEEEDGKEKETEALKARYVALLCLLQRELRVAQTRSRTLLQSLEEQQEANAAFQMDITTLQAALAPIQLARQVRAAVASEVAHVVTQS